jgi:hypothetical protein
MFGDAVQHNLYDGIYFRDSGIEVEKQIEKDPDFYKMNLEPSSIHATLEHFQDASSNAFVAT